MMAAERALGYMLCKEVCMLHFSIQFWKHYKRQFFLLVSTIVLSSMVLLVLLFLLRGQFMEQYETALDGNGNYNYYMLSPSKKQVKKIKKSGVFQAFGVVYEEGKMRPANASSDDDYLLASTDTQGEDLYHVRCEKGRYPKKKGEIALTADVLKRFGAAPVIGEKVTITQEGSSSATYVLCGILKDVERFSDGELVYPDGFIKGNSDTPLFAMGVERSVRKTNAFLDQNQIAYTSDDGKSLAEAFYVDSDEASVEATNKALAGASLSDFESALLIPLFGGLLSVMVCIALCYALSSILMHRRASLAFFCLLGMTNKQAKKILLTELFVIAAGSWIIGLILGTAGYEGMVLLLRKALHTPLVSALEANKIIRAVTLDPFLVTTGMTLFACLSAILLSFWNWQSIRPLEALQLKERKTKKTKKQKTVSVRGILRVGAAHHAINLFLIFAVIASLGFFTLYFYAKFQADAGQYKEEVKQADLGDYDYLLWRDMANDGELMLLRNRWDDGINPEQIQKLKKDSQVRTMTYCMQMPEIMIMENKTANSMLGATLKEMEQKTGMNEDLASQSDALTGYSEKERDALYNISMVGVDKEKLSKDSDDFKLLAGKINPDKLSTGEEVLLACYKEEDQESLPYQVGDTITFSDVVLDPSDPAYNFDFRTYQLPEHSGSHFTYEENGEKREGVSYGTRKDFTAKVGGIVYLSDGKDSFYYKSSNWGENQFQIMISAAAPTHWGLPHHCYTKLGVSLKASLSEKKSSRGVYSLYANSKDTKMKSVYEIKQKIWNQELKYGLVLVIIAVLLFLVGLMSIYQCMELQLIEARQNIGVLRILGVTRGQILSIYLKRYGIYIGINCLLGWLPLGLYQLKEWYLAKKAKEILDSFGATGELSEGVRMLGSDVHTGWLYNLRGGSYDLLTGLRPLLYVVVIAVSAACVLLFVKTLVARRLSGDLLKDIKTEE